MGAESSGTVTLQSTDPKDPPIIDPQFLSHPFDRRVAIECVRDALDFLDQPFLAQDRERLVHGPKGLSDDEILVSSVLRTFGPGINTPFPAAETIGLI